MEHISGYLRGTSTQADSMSSCLYGQYDLGIVFSSWDARSTIWKDATGLRCAHGLIIHWSTADNRGLRPEHDKQIEKFSHALFGESKVIAGNSSDLESMATILVSHILSISTRLGRPLKIAFDVSTCPRYYSLAILAICIRMRIVTMFSLTYAEGIYEKNPEHEDYVFTEGGWRIVPIPGLEGAHDVGLKKHYLVSVGFEGQKTLRAVNQEDPDRISLLYPSPAFRPEYEGVTLEHNRQMIERYAVPSDQIFRARAGDAIEVWRALTSGDSCHSASDNTFYLCCGTKAHALGMALAAITKRKASVLYVLPDMHSVQKITPSGVYWRYDIFDLSIISP